MNLHRLTAFARTFLAAASLVALTSAPAAAQSDIVLHAKNASTVVGDWQRVSDSSAAGGARMWNPDRGAGKLSSPYASPYDYFDLTFTAEAGRPYRIWVRGRADDNAWNNDSIFAQFSGSVYASGGASYRIGSTSAAIISLEACSGCGVSGWGWQDNGYDGPGPTIYFGTTGPQTIRIQRREDGVSIDQIVISAGQYVTSAPGSRYNDTTLLTASSSSSSPSTPSAQTPSAGSSDTEIVIPVAAAATVRGNWRIVSDSGAASGARVWNPDAGLGKLGSALASPTDYFEVTFNAQAGRAYRLWVRGKADYDSWSNDSVYVQFDRSVNSSGSGVDRIGSTDATIVSLEDCSGCGLSGWGWSDNGWASLGPLVYFSTTGTQKMRVQRREDGVSIDQIVLSSSQYLSSAPGSAKNDTTVLGGGSTGTSSDPAPEPAPAPAPEPATSGSTGGVRLRVVEWNIHHGVGTDGSYNIDRLATWLARWSPDVIMLNEVEKYTSWGNEDQPARFKALMQSKTGRTWYTHFSQEYGQWSSNGKGHLILSTFPIESVNHATISASRVVSQATITVNGRTINLLLTHLDPYDQSLRLTQAREVINWASSYAENRILGGDMNAWPDQSSIAELNKTYSDAWTQAVNRGTATGISGISPFGATKNGRIDYIFSSKGASNLVVLDATTPDTRDGSGNMPSDHRPVVVTFEVR